MSSPNPSFVVLVPSAEGAPGSPGLSTEGPPAAAGGGARKGIFNEGLSGLGEPVDTDAGSGETAHSGGGGSSGPPVSEEKPGPAAGSGAEDGGSGEGSGLGTESGSGSTEGSSEEGSDGSGSEGSSKSASSAEGGSGTGTSGTGSGEAGVGTGESGSGEPKSDSGGSAGGSGTGGAEGVSAGSGGTGSEGGSGIAGGSGAGSTESGSGTSGAEGGLGSTGSGGATEPFRFFSPSSFWNASPPAAATLDPSSSTVVAALAAEVAQEEDVKKGPAVNTTAWSVPLYTVPAGQPTVKVTLPYASLNSTLQAAWEAVPLPPDALPAAGTDKHLVVWQPSSDQLWEFWHLEKTAEGWEAYWGGAIQHVSSASGSYGPEAWLGAKTSWGASASSLSIAGGLITLEDLEKGTINHALAIAVPNTREGVYASPAERTDGGSSVASSLPEGAHLRLNPSLDLASLHLPHFTLMLAEAAQRYGIFVRDTAANVAFYAQDPTPTGGNPYTGKTGYYEGKSPAQLLAAFPWSELQLLKMELHS